MWCVVSVCGDTILETLFVIVAASRACKICNFFAKRSKVRKGDHALLPEGIQIEDLTQASCHA